MRVRSCAFQVFAEPLKLRLTTSEHNAIFSNITELLPCNEAILTALEQLQQQDHYLIQRVGVRARVIRPSGPVDAALMLRGGGGEGEHTARQGLLSTLLTKLDPYITYCSNQFNATQTLTRKIQSDPTFAHIISVRHRAAHLVSACWPLTAAFVLALGALVATECVHRRFAKTKNSES